ncbi:MAG: tripartite tricarboxylate transporter TctB family protein [Bauldia sp.]|nr:tripartite tricarboxylate transporter TctB family protein [Bauldia sp.]MCW5716744.1 tripartite tricarboxylate transporter TctB family protein [Bauldia sp.]
MTRNRQDIAVGVIFVAIGLLFGFDVWRTELDVGTPLRMGPGFFPVILASVLVVLGAAIAIRGAIARIPPEAFRAIPWRGLLFIAPLPVFFGLTIEGLGLVLPIFVVAFAASFASREVRLVSAFATAAGVTAFCVVVFHTLAGLPLPLFGPWFDFLRS